MPANLSMVALERGAFRDTYPDGAYPKTIDELTYLQRFKLFQNLALSSFTFRHGIGDQAVSYRQIGAFRPGDGVGGAGLHWAGMHWRVLPEELSLSWRWYPLRSRSLRSVPAAAAEES